MAEKDDRRDGVYVNLGALRAWLPTWRRPTTLTGQADSERLNDEKRAYFAQGEAHGRGELRERVAEIAAAWDVWGEAQHAIRRLVRAAEWSGDLPDAGQRGALQQQFNAQIFEAYARSRLQCVIVRAVDGVDQADSYDQHWRETWGDAIAAKAAAVYADAFAAALERQQQARAAAAMQGPALEAAGVPT
jgi:hypothetical protein